ncbi:hypothetical protein GGP41_009707 [Bipolaris sorokiniana]|uniref:Uncharacterized protein n=2 Tax=Cochliobolus sativus TaxID=45130 RepID=A0A8H6DU65_COCSA|nr:uncharacterized protein COCSADRAFT_194765 [Bipolaris sorokiniana ND90Pr]EMD58310.1 hypothetical protein COCSADRAFT_194765 [Bipolaris sorokiniana ND90Pr]KAF5848566.1 hypothetical protein GGP41_009707 [Bipolaris sorokiniana]
MSGLEVVAAVAAVVSAFHAGSELLKHVRKKRSARKARNSAQQEWEEERLQASLVAGEQQIGLHYDQDQRELGDLVRIGDDIARERLYHVTLMLQAEIINSLKQAATSEVCVLDLRVLHQASLTNRKETLVTLEELKQRIYLRRPMARQPQDFGDKSRLWQSRFLPPTTQSSHEPTHALHDAYADYPRHAEYRTTRHGSTENYHPLGIKDMSTPTLPAYVPAHAFGEDLSNALERIHPDHRATVMRDIRQMINSYQSLSFSSGHDQQQIHGYSGSYTGLQEPLGTPSPQDVSETTMTESEQDPHHKLHQVPRVTTDQNGTHSTRTPTSNKDMFALESEQFDYRRPFIALNKHSHAQARASRQPRWSESSGASSDPSYLASLNRNSSNSSQGSSNQTPEQSQQSQPFNHGRIPSVPTTLDGCYQLNDKDYQSLPSPCSPHEDSEERYDLPHIAPLAPSRNQPKTLQNGVYRKAPTHKAVPVTTAGTNPPIHVPWPGIQQHREISSATHHGSRQRYRDSFDEKEAFDTSDMRLPKYTVEITANNAPANTSGHHRSVSGLSAITAAAAVLNPKNLTRKASINQSLRSHRSTSSSSSTSMPIGVLPGHRMHSIRHDTIHSGPVGSDTMMNGRPDKGNNYWGFCKGAWAVREDLTKGLAVRAQPAGLYATKSLWACKSCTFTGDVFKAPHPTKKNKTLDVVDPRIKVSNSGIRYRWIFLAKSHVKKKAGAASAEANSGSTSAASNDDNYGCIFCCLQDKITGVYGGVETLMNHIAQVHVADMSEVVRRKAHCVLGRVAGTNEEFDINIPIFG